MSQFKSRLRFASKLSSLHFLISCFIAALMALIVFKLWYPHPFDKMLGGLELFFIVCSVDVVCGPLMTLILANPKKSKRETALDFSIIGLIQISALLYGLHTVYVARPIYYAFDKDRFVTVALAQLEKEQIEKAPEHLQKLPKTGPVMISLSKQQSVDLDSIMLSLSGVEAIARPERWIDFNPEDTQAIRQKMFPIQMLYDSHVNKDKKSIIDKAVAKTGITADKLYFLPFTCDRNLDWSALLNEQGEIVGYVDADGFGQ